MDFSFVGTETEADWRRWSGNNFEVTDEGVTLATRMTYGPPVAITKEPPAFEPVDADLDECGDLYVLGQEECDEGSNGSVDTVIYRYDPRTEMLQRLPCAPDDEEWFADPRGICVTGASVYIVDGARVRAYSKHLLQTRWIAETPFEEQPYRFESPVRILNRGECVYILDRSTDGAPSLARLLRDGTVRRITLDGLSTTPTDAAVDDEGFLYVLGEETVARFDLPDESVASTGPESTLRATPAGEWAPPNGASCLAAGERISADDAGETTRRELFVGGRSDAPSRTELHRYVFEDDDFGGGRLEAPTAVNRGCSRLVLRGERADGTRGRTLFGVDRPEKRVYALAETTANRVGSETLPYDATLFRRFDSGDAETDWHRVRTGFELAGPHVQVELHYFATDDDNRTENLRAIPGIGDAYARRLRRAGARTVSELVELTPEEIANIVGTPSNPVSPTRAETWLQRARKVLVEWTALGRSNPRDALFESAEGRYLWVSLRLLGSESTSPRVASFRAYFERQSYLRYLPPVYREDPASEAFLVRFLSLFESVFTDLEEEIEHLTKCFDPCGVPPAYLSWLGRWLALDADETWPEAARRDLLAGAPELFKRRGTRRGLLDLLAIYFWHAEPPETWWNRQVRRQIECESEEANAGPVGEALAPLLRCDRSSTASRDEELFFVLEYSDLDCIDSAEAKKDYRRLLECPQCFSVLVRPELADEQLRTVKRIVDESKPAHSVGSTVELRPATIIGGHTFLGVNTVLADPEFVLERTGLGEDSVLTEREPDGQLDSKARLGEDAVIS